MGYDALLEGAAIKRLETKTGTVSKRRFAAKPSAAKIRANEKLRAGVLF